MKRIRKFALSLAMLLFLVSPVLAQSPVKIYFMGADGKEKLISATDPLPVTGDFVITGVSTEATLAQVLATLNEALDPDSGFYFSPTTGSTWNIGNWPTVQKVEDDTIPDTWYADVQAKLAALTSDVPLTMTVYELTLADTAAVDSSVNLPAKCVAFEFWTVNTTHTLKWMINSGTYVTKNPGVPYNTFGLGSEKIYAGRLYFKDTTEAGCVVNVIVWTKP